MKQDYDYIRKISMKRLIALLGSGVLNFSIWAQSALPLPRCITIVSSSGGDYRFTKHPMSIRTQKDSLVYMLDAESTMYESKEQFHEMHIYIPGDTGGVDISETPIWRSDYPSFAEMKYVKALLVLLDTNQHEKYEVKDSILHHKKREEAVWYGYRRKDYDWVDYGLNEIDIDCLCRHYEQRIREKEPWIELKYTCNDTARRSAVFREWMKRNTGVQVLSSSHWSIYLDIDFGDRKIGILQAYSGGFNVSWNFYYNDELKQFQVLSPKINLAVYHLLPQSFLLKESLMEYQDGYALYRMMLSNR